jgi:hypothetical protein
MAYTVGEVAKIAKVSVRALHHWDEIGLVKPSRLRPKGYRLYTDHDLDRLQQVLFYRELGFRWRTSRRRSPIGDSIAARRCVPTARTSPSKSHTRARCSLSSTAPSAPWMEKRP